MLITLGKWLSLFDTPKNKNMTYTNFIKVAKVKSSGKTRNLHELIKNKQKRPGQTTESIMKIIYHHVVINKRKYLENIYNRSFKIPITGVPKDYPLCISNNKNTEYKNIIRNMYYKEILQETSTVQPNLRPYLEVILELYRDQILDYKLVTPSVIEMMFKNQFSNVLSGLYFRSSIMNPIVPYSLSMHPSVTSKGNKFKVLTPTLGWSSYLLGMLNNSNLSEYVGIDVIPKVCDNTRNIANKNKIKNSIFCKPSEDLYKDKSFMIKYRNYFDFVFFSPPYFQLELYKGKNQSTERYKTYEEWLEKYWRQTVKLCKHSLKSNKLMMYIISGYTDNTYINLEKDMNGITKEEGFVFVKKLDMVGNNVGITKHRKLKESVFIFSNGRSVIETGVNSYYKRINECK